MAIVYKHIRKDTNEVFYIGIGKTIKRVYSKHGRNSMWKNIVNKTEFEVEIIEDGLSWEEACEWEKYWITYYGRRDLNEGTLVNMTNGGEGVVNYQHTHYNKMVKSIRMGGSGNHFYGKTHTDEVKSILSVKCRKFGVDNNFYGKTHTDEVRNMLSNIGKRRAELGTLPQLPVMCGSKNPSSIPLLVIDYNTNTVYKIYGGIKKFCNEMNLSYHYYKLFRDNGRCYILKSTHVRANSKNTVNWEFKTVDLINSSWEFEINKIKEQIGKGNINVIKY